MKPEDLPAQTPLARDAAVEVRVRWFIAALALGCASVAQAEPRRIVSLDYCADQFVIALADRQQIAALSVGARRDDSYFRNRARDIPQTRDTLEEVLALRPDLVVLNWGGPWDAEQVYARFHLPVLQVGDTPDFASARADLLDAAQVLGHPDRGAAIARDLDARLARLSAHRSNAPVMHLSGGGAVAGRGTMMDAMITAAGGRNVRTEASWQVLPLERMVQTPPALIALGFFDTSRDRVNAWSPSRHPALRRAVTTTIAATFRAGAGLVHHEVAAVEILAIGAFNGLPASIVIGHLHEAAAAAPVGGAIHDDFGRSHFSEWFEEFTEILVPHSVRHVGDANVHEFY